MLNFKTDLSSITKLKLFWENGWVNKIIRFTTIIKKYYFFRNRK